MLPMTMYSPSDTRWDGNWNVWLSLEDQIWDEAQSAWMLMEMAEMPSDEEDASRRLVEALDKAPVTHL